MVASKHTTPFGESFHPDGSYSYNHAEHSMIAPHATSMGGFGSTRNFRRADSSNMGGTLVPLKRANDNESDVESVGSDDDDGGAQDSDNANG